MDNDIYTHINNVTYYSYFDSQINRYLIEEGGLDIQNAAVVAYVVNSNCHYLSPIAYPEKNISGYTGQQTGKWLGQLWGEYF